MVKRKTGDREVLVRFRVDAVFLCVYFSILFIFLFFFFFFFFFDKRNTYILLDNMSSLKNAGSVTLTIVVNDSCCEGFPDYGKHNKMTLLNAIFQFNIENTMSWFL